MPARLDPPRMVAVVRRRW